jgi:hypothetical protein
MKSKTDLLNIRLPDLLKFHLPKALALNVWLLSAYSNPYSGELKLQPSMFQLLKSSVLVVPDGPSRFLHDK